MKCTMAVRIISPTRGKYMILSCDLSTPILERDINFMWTITIRPQYYFTTCFSVRQEPVGPCASTAKEYLQTWKRWSWRRAKKNCHDQRHPTGHEMEGKERCARVQQCTLQNSLMSWARLIGPQDRQFNAPAALWITTSTWEQRIGAIRWSPTLHSNVGPSSGGRKYFFTC